MVQSWHGRLVTGPSAGRTGGAQVTSILPLMTSHPARFGGTLELGTLAGPFIMAGKHCLQRALHARLITSMILLPYVEAACGMKGVAAGKTGWLFCRDQAL